MLTVNAYAAPSATAPLVKTTIERRDVGPKDVLIEIKYAGICHSDIHPLPLDYAVVPRLDFYERAKNVFAVVHTLDSRPYGCFILQKGVVFV